MDGTRHRQGGAAMMMSALLITVLAGAGMLWNLEVRAVQGMQARARAAGALFAQWFRAAHAHAQTEDAHYRNLIALHGGVRLPSDSLRSVGLVPAWMSARTDAGQTVTLGIIDDGHGVPMAFALATPSRPVSAPALESFVVGAVAGRVGDVAGPGRESRATRWQEAIERLLGRALQPGELYATADAGIAYDRRVMHRREQPGRAGQARMETSLSFADGAGISDIGEVDALRAEFAEELTVGALQSQGALVAQNASMKGDVRARHAKTQTVAVHTSLDAMSMRAGEIGARRLMIEAELASRNVRSSGAVAAPGVFLIDGDLEASGTRSGALMSERMEAWGAPGRLHAHGGVEVYHSTGDHAEFEGRVSVTGRCAGC